MSPITIVPAEEHDLPEVLELLRSQELPVLGLERHLSETLVAKQAGAIVGTVAVEMYADGGLLRSVAVADVVKGTGLGRALTDRALQLARDRGLRNVFLLTTTAERYFPKFGFENISRDDVPDSVRQSVEFTTACPASAVVMRLRL